VDIQGCQRGDVDVPGNSKSRISRIAVPRILFALRVGDKERIRFKRRVNLRTERRNPSNWTFIKREREGGGEEEGEPNPWMTLIESRSHIAVAPSGPCVHEGETRTSGSGSVRNRVESERAGSSSPRPERNGVASGVAFGGAERAMRERRKESSQFVGAANDRRCRSWTRRGRASIAVIVVDAR